MATSPITPIYEIYSNGAGALSPTGKFTTAAVTAFTSLVLVGKFNQAVQGKTTDVVDFSFALGVTLAGAFLLGKYAGKGRPMIGRLASVRHRDAAAKLTIVS